jgi:CheY-like chemotaxis protein
VTLPRILLVDDSDAILAYETAALGRDYVLAQASDGLAALREMRRETPELVLLDLSMPLCDGDEVLLAMRKSPELSEVPVIVVTSESARGEECLKKGAKAFLPKPTTATELRRVVAEVLRDATRAKEAGDVHALVFSVGSLTLALLLSAVGEVVLEPATTMALLEGEPFPSFDLHGEPVAILDVAARLGRARTAAPVDRWDIVLRGEHRTFALSVDAVAGPEVFPGSSVILGQENRERIPAHGHIHLGDVVIPLLAYEALLPRRVES